MGSIRVASKGVYTDGRAIIQRGENGKPSDRGLFRTMFSAAGLAETRCVGGRKGLLAGFATWRIGGLLLEAELVAALAVDHVFARVR